MIHLYCLFFFFFKQNTAYEMRISDGVQTCALPISSSSSWLTSIMCDENSGRHAALIDTGSAILVTSVPLARQAPSTLLAFRPIASSATVAVHSVRPNSQEMEAGGLRCNTPARSEARGVGKESVSTWRFRGSRDH